MPRSTQIKCSYLVAAVVLAVLSGVVRVARAEVTVGAPALYVEVASATGAGVFSLEPNELSWNPATQAIEWSMGEALVIADAASGLPLATFESLSVQFRGCSKIRVTFELLAGAEDIDVVLQSARLSLPAIHADLAEGFARGSFSLKDIGGDGALLSSSGAAGSGIFAAHYNGDALFANLVSEVYVSGGGFGSGSQRHPAFGAYALGEELSDLSVDFAFTLSAADWVTADGYFDVNPDPESCGTDQDGDGWPDWLDGCPDDPLRTDSCADEGGGDGEGGGDTSGGSGTAEDEPFLPWVEPGSAGEGDEHVAGDSTQSDGDGDGEPGAEALPGQADAFDETPPPALALPCGAGAVMPLTLTLLVLVGAKGCRKA